MKSAKLCKFFSVQLSLILIFLLTSCSSIHPITLIDKQSGQYLKGQYNESNHSVNVYMSDGEILEGNYTINRSSSFTFGSMTSYGNNKNYFDNTTLWTNSISSNGQAYAILRGSKGTVMEILVNFTGSSGFGQAISNKGKQYGVQF